MSGHVGSSWNKTPKRFLPTLLSSWKGTPGPDLSLNVSYINTLGLILFSQLLLCWGSYWLGRQRMRNNFVIIYWFYHLSSPWKLAMSFSSSEIQKLRPIGQIQPIFYFWYGLGTKTFSHFLMIQNNQKKDNIFWGNQVMWHFSLINKAVEAQPHPLICMLAGAAFLLPQ